MITMKFPKQVGARSALSVLVVVLMSACSQLDVYKVHDEFDGIQSLYETSDTISVLIVHGMGEHLPGYSQELQGSIAQRLDMVRDNQIVERRRLEANGYPLGTITRSRFIGRGSNKKRFNVVELSWSEATMPIKTTLLELDKANKHKERGFLESQRLSLNSAGKAFVNTHLSDPVIYIGAFGPILRNTVKQAICSLFSDSPDQTAGRNVPCSFNDVPAATGELVIISSSLGSALVFDTAVELFSGDGAERVAAQKLISGTKRIFMFANQLPLLELRELDVVTGPNWLDNYPCPTRSPEEASRDRPQISGLRGFLTLRRGFGAKEEALDPKLTLSIVAFNDPNDLLTYEMTDRFKKHCGPAKFANVTVTNAETGWLFMAADPMKAHMGYEDNARVVDLIVKGYPPARQSSQSSR